MVLFSPSLLIEAFTVTTNTKKIHNSLVDFSVMPQYVITLQLAISQNAKILQYNAFSLF